MDYNDLFIDCKLQEPLSQIEMYDYFRKYKSGDMGAREIIIKSNIKLVIDRVMKRFRNTCYERNELVEVGLIGLIKSVDTFDISRNFCFSTYAVKCIDNEILMFMRNNKKYVENNISIDETLESYKDSDDLKIGSLLNDENSDFVSDYERNESYLVIRKLINDLPERERKIIVLYFGFVDDKPLKQSEIADKLNITQSQVSRLLTMILKKISVQLEEEGIIDSDRKVSRTRKVRVRKNI